MARTDPAAGSSGRPELVGPLIKIEIASQDPRGPGTIFFFGYAIILSMTKIATKTAKASKASAKYVDGFVLIIPKKNVEAYKKMAKIGKQAWIKYGALDYKECMGEDLSIKPEMGSPAPSSFIKLAKASPDDTVWFSYITFKNKKHRDQVNRDVMAYFEKKYASMGDEPMPFDPRKTAYGGFSVVVSA